MVPKEDKTHICLCNGREHRPYSVNELAKVDPLPGSWRYLILPQTSFCGTTLGIKNTSTLDELQAVATVNMGWIEGHFIYCMRSSHRIFGKVQHSLWKFMSKISLTVHHTLKGNFAEEKSFVFSETSGEIIWVPTISWWWYFREEECCVLSPAEVRICFRGLHGLHLHGWTISQKEADVK
jgi:hypothetical protein